MSHRFLASARAALGAALVAVTFASADVAHAQYSMVGDRKPRYEWGGSVATDFRAEFDTKSTAGDAFESWRTGIQGAQTGWKD